jgi:excisionase family DNA binding protein
MDKMLTVEMVAEQFNVSPRTVVRLIEKGHMQALRVGRQWRMEPAWVEEWVKLNKTEVRKEVG